MKLRCRCRNSSVISRGMTTSSRRSGHSRDSSGPGRELPGPERCVNLDEAACPGVVILVVSVAER